MSSTFVIINVILMRGSGLSLYLNNDIKEAHFSRSVSVNVVGN